MSSGEDFFLNFLQKYIVYLSCSILCLLFTLRGGVIHFSAPFEMYHFPQYAILLYVHHFVFCVENLLYLKMQVRYFFSEAFLHLPLPWTCLCLPQAPLSLMKGSFHPIWFQPFQSHRPTHLSAGGGKVN